MGAASPRLLSRPPPIADHGDDPPEQASPSIPWGTDEDGPVKVVSPLDPVGADDASADASPSSWTGSAPAGAAPRAGEVVTVVGVRVTVAGRVQPCDTGGLHLVPGDRVIVDGERGPRLGTVATAATRTQPRERLRRISRRATDDDLAADAGTRDADRRALRLAKDRAAALRLPIKVFRVEHSGGTPVGGGAGSGDRPDRGGRMIVHYTSDDRLELGGLARDLTMATDARVELRAIGARDEAKVIGGIGTCGLELCCSTWLPEFVPISIKMAKDQGLVLNPTKVAGQCGRLKCCLVYEQATYAEMRKGLPKLGKRVITPQGEGRVVEVDVLRQRVRVSYGMGESEVLAATEVQPMFPAGGGGGGQPARRDERGPRRDDRRGPPGGTPHDDRPPTAAALAAETHDDDDEADDDDLAVGGEDAAPPAPEPEPEPDDPADDFPDPDDDLPS